MTGKTPDLPWITDRLPTRTESDPNGNLVCLRRGFLELIRWDHIQRDDPWLPYRPPLEPWQQPRKVPRKVEQFEVMNRSGAMSLLLALADDGTLWHADEARSDWSQIKPLPEREEEP